VAGNEKGDGDGDKEGDGNQWQQHGQWLRQRGLRAFEGNNDGGGAKDNAACATTGERGVMVVTGYGLCVFWCVWRDHKK
jgi:hypothetical protein